jgi:hypothetical protein
LDHEPECLWPVPSGSRGTRTHKRVVPAACFQDRFLIQSDDFRDFQIAGVGIEPTPPGSEPSIATSSDYPAMTVSTDTINLERFANCEGRNRTCELVVQSHGFLPAETTSQWESALRESNPPVQGGSLAPLPLGQGHVCFIKAEAVGLEPTIPKNRDTCFRGRPLIQPDDFPSSSCGDRNRTRVVTINSRLPVPAQTPPQCFSVSVVGFEPTFSCARGTRISRLSHTLIIIHREWIVVDMTDHPREQKSTQRELNPHLRLGETVRCRYVMGA